MTKSSFFQNNIKKKKREKKVRNLEQKKHVMAKQKIEASKKATEQRIEENKEMIKQQTDQNVADLLNKPSAKHAQVKEEAKTVRLVIDTNIIKAVFLKQEKVIDAIKNYGKNDFSVILLARIISEFISMEKHKFEMDHDWVEIGERLEVLGRVEYTKLRLDIIKKAEELVKSGKYVERVDGEEKRLSLTDCILLEYAIALDSAVLVTGDRRLLKATKKEAQFRKSSTDVLYPYDPEKPVDNIRFY